MAADNFWNNREQAQKLIEEANTLRGKTEPLLKAEKQLEDFHVMVELGEAEPADAQTKIQDELEQDLSNFFKELDSLELKVFLNGPHDKSNCIMSINAGAGGTESCDWANMLMRMYQRWVESRGSLFHHSLALSPSSFLPDRWSARNARASRPVPCCSDIRESQPLVGLACF